MGRRGALHCKLFGSVECSTVLNYFFKNITVGVVAKFRHGCRGPEDT